MSKLTTAKLLDMLECAKKATPGKREVLGDGAQTFVDDHILADYRHELTDWEEDSEKAEREYKQNNLDAIHDANMDPQTTIALIEEVLRARGEAMTATRDVATDAEIAETLRSVGAGMNIGCERGRRILNRLAASEKECEALRAENAAILSDKADEFLERVGV